MCPGDENAREAEQDQYPSMALASAIPAHEKKSGNVKSHKRHGDVTEIRNQFRFVMRRNKAKLQIAETDYDANQNDETRNSQRNQKTKNKNETAYVCSGALAKSS